MKRAPSSSRTVSDRPFSKSKKTASSSRTVSDRPFSKSKKTARSSRTVSDRPFSKSKKRSDLRTVVSKPYSPSSQRSVKSPGIAEQLITRARISPSSVNGDYRKEALYFYQKYGGGERIRAHLNGARNVVVEERVIGKGAYGIVSLLTLPKSKLNAASQSTETYQVVLKAQDCGDEYDTEKKIISGLAILGTARYPYTPLILDAWGTFTECYLVLPVMDGDLKKLLRGTKFNKGEMKTLLKQAFIQLITLSDKVGYLHCDAHAGNWFYKIHDKAMPPVTMYGITVPSTRLELVMYDPGMARPRSDSGSGPSCGGFSCFYDFYRLLGKFSGIRRYLKKSDLATQKMLKAMHEFIMNEGEPYVETENYEECKDLKQDSTAFDLETTPDYCLYFQDEGDTRKVVDSLIEIMEKY